MLSYYNNTKDGVLSTIKLALCKDLILKTPGKHVRVVLKVAIRGKIFGWQCRIWGNGKEINQISRCCICLKNLGLDQENVYQQSDQVFFFFFSKPFLTQKEKLNLKTCNSTLLDIYEILVGEKLKSIKRKENIIILKFTHK